MGDEDISSPSFQKEIADFTSSLEAGGVTSRANWITQDSAGGWCGYTGVITASAAATAIVVRALSPALVAYLKGRAGRKVQIEYRGGKLKIDRASPEEIDRALKLFEQQIAQQIEAKAASPRARNPAPSNSTTPCGAARTQIIVQEFLITSNAVRISSFGSTQSVLKVSRKPQPILPRRPSAVRSVVGGERAIVSQVRKTFCSIKPLASSRMLLHR